MFASRLGRFLGRISFTLYLVHIPILCSFTAALVLAMKEMGRLPMLLVCGPATVAVVLGLSWLTSDAIDGGGVRVSRAAGRQAVAASRRARSAESWGMPIRLIKHEAVPECGSFEVRFSDGRPSQHFYFEDNPDRRLGPEQLTGEEGPRAGQGVGARRTGQAGTDSQIPPRVPILNR